MGEGTEGPWHQPGFPGWGVGARIDEALGKNRVKSLGGCVSGEKARSFLEAEVGMDKPSSFDQKPRLRVKRQLRGETDSR